MSALPWALQGIKDPPPGPLVPGPAHSTDPFDLIGELFTQEWVVPAVLIGSAAVLVLALLLVIGHQVALSRRARRAVEQASEGEKNERRSIWTSG